MTPIIEIDSAAPVGPVPFPAEAPADTLYRFRNSGILLEIPRRMLATDIWESLCLGQYEARELSGLVGLVRPGDTVLELGAGLGFIGCHLARAVHPGRVVSVEADPDVAALARHTHALNGVEVDLRVGLVANGAGTATLHRHDSFWSNSTAWLPDTTPVTLEAIGFAGLLAEVRPQVLVLDIEGAECALFDDADLGGIRCISLELHRRLTGLAGIRRLFQALGAAGFGYDPTWSSGAVVVFGKV